MDPKIYFRLSVMMLLQFFVWGVWFVTLGTYLGTIGFSAGRIGDAYLMNNIAAIISPFFVGMIADRYFKSQKVMGVLHLAGAAIMYWASGTTAVAPLIIGLLLYNLTFMPTLALVNAVSFKQMKSPDAEFPRVRLWGTIGWIVAGLLISFIQFNYYDQIEKSSVPMKLAAAASVLLGLYSFTLPDTPPQNVGKQVTFGEVMGLKALRLMKERSFFFFVLCSLLISIPLAFYYNFTNPFLNDLGMKGVAGLQTMGQMSEVGFMLLMPFFFRRLGVKWMLLVGMLAWVVRYALFANGNAGPLVWMLYTGIILHGICFDFFFVTGQVYVDKKSPQEIRASAQGFIALITYGVGQGIGSMLSGRLIDAYTIDGVKDWPMIWWIPCMFGAGVSLLFALTFKDSKADEPALEPKPVVEEA
jgi:nucleoside transporter